MGHKIANLLIGLLIIFFIEYVSIFLVGVMNISFPPALVGMIVLSLLLYFKIVPMKLMKDSCDLLLNNMVLFFVPVTLGVIMYMEVISNNLLIIAVVITVSTLLTLISTGLVADYFVEKKKKKLNNE